MSDEMSVEDIQTNLCSIVTGHEEKEKWEYVAGFNAAVAILMPQVQLRDAKVKTLREENRRLWSIAIVRRYIEDIDEKIDESFKCPNKDDMMQTVVTHPQWVCALENPNYRYVKFFYFIISQHTFAQDIRSLLNNNGILIHDFCRLVVKVFKKTSDRIHQPLVHLTASEIKEGLKFYGFDENELLDCVDILISIRNVSVQRRHPSTAGQSSWTRSHLQPSQFSQRPSFASSSTSSHLPLPQLQPVFQSPRYSMQQRLPYSAKRSSHSSDSQFSSKRRRS